MKLIITGSRHFSSSYDIVKIAIECIPELRIAYQNNQICEVISGCAFGIDTAGERWARGAHWDLAGKEYPILTKFPADWDKLGKAAGPIRNKQMAEYSDALLLIWNGTSPGSKNMKMNMEKLGKPVYEVIFCGTQKKET